LQEHEITVEVNNPLEGSPFLANNLRAACKRPSVSSTFDPFCR